MSEFPAVDRFIRDLDAELRIGDRQVFYRTGAYGRLFINFYNVPRPYRGDSAEGENNRLMLDVTGLESAAGKIRVELAVRGPSFGADYKLRAKTTSVTGAVKYIAEYLNRASQKAPYGFHFDQLRERGLKPNAPRYRLDEYVVGDYIETTYGKAGHVKEISARDGLLVKFGDGDKLWVSEAEVAYPARDESRHNPNARRTEADPTAARELSLYIENDSSLVGDRNSQGKAIEANLLRKIRNGSFDLEKSEQAWMYLMEAGAKKYAKEFGSSVSEWSTMFNKATRELVAHEFATTFYEENKGS